MVRKLFKHEFSAYWRVLIPAWMALIGVAFLGRVLQFLESESTVYNIVSGSSMVFYGIAIIVALAFPFVYAIIRFYRNLFTGEGYLSFTLPVTPAQHIWVKVLTAVTLQLASLVVVLLSAMVMTAGELLVELWKAATYILEKLHGYLGAHFVWFVVELVIFLVVALIAASLFYDTCITIGQLFRKNRVLAAVGVFFAFYVLEQIIGTIIVLIAAFADWESLMVFVRENAYLCSHLSAWILILFTAAIGLILYVVTHHIIGKRLNLE